MGFSGTEKERLMKLELALSLEGLWFAPSSECVTAAASLLWTETPSLSLTQRDASRAGSGSWSTMHQELTDLEALVYLSFILPTPSRHPRKSLIVFYHNHRILGIGKSLNVQSST